MHLICYLSTGYPSIEKSIEIAQLYVKAGCTIIEMGFPSKNPFLENDLIAGQMHKALSNCADYEQYMQCMIRVKEGFPQTKFILMTYEETVQEIGVKHFIHFCLAHGFHDIILVGTKNDIIKKQMISKGLRISCYVQFRMSDSEVEYALDSNGFVYLQAFPKQKQINPDYPTLKDCITGLRERGLANPIYCGVGIQSPEDVGIVKAAGADAAFVGSAILRLYDDTPALTHAIRAMKACC